MTTTLSNPKRSAFLRLVLLSAALTAAAALIWSALHEEGRASNSPESDYKMSSGSVFGEHGLSGAAAAGLGESDRQNAAKSQGSKDNRGGVGGTNENGVPIQPKKLPSIPALPDHAPDTNGGAITPQPVDLSLIAAETAAPARKPLQRPTVGGAQITGMSGVFIP